MLKIYGASDDLVEIEGPGGDEVDCFDKGVNIVIGKPEAMDGQNAFGIRVKMRYVSGGVWAATLEPIEEDVPCPWPVTVTIHKYSSVVTIDCPDETPVSWKRVTAKKKS